MAKSIYVGKFVHEIYAFYVIYTVWTYMCGCRLLVDFVVFRSQL